uniref:Small ribosomal subunit protein eS21 n=1 Tax=Capra hircus TaxID=9925 RepID=A0A452DPN4_CAPHI
MQNDAGEFVDLYVPRKCSASNRVICMNVAEVDKVTGRFNGHFKTCAICGAIRRMGESDDFSGWPRPTPESCNCLSHVPHLLKSEHPRAHAVQQETPLQ